jgi:DNA (cytosine-5)-methyltransferase 1
MGTEIRSKDTLGDTREEKQQWVRENGVLTVRWKFVTTTDEIKHARWDA